MTTRAALMLGGTLAVGTAAAGAGYQATLGADLDALFETPALARALTAVRIESLDSSAVLYERNAGRHVIPASNMKIITMAVAAERLGWDFRFETRLEIVGEIADGTLTGDLVVVGGGDPSIGSQDEGPSPVFLSWIDALRDAGIQRIDGRLIGDDNAFDDDGLGAGWAWDNLNAGYSAPSGALSYNENVAVIRITPARVPGDPADVLLTPPSQVFDLAADVMTGAAGSDAVVSVNRDIGSQRLTVRGSVPAGVATVMRSTAVRNPTRFFVEGLRLALQARGIFVSGGAWDIDDVEFRPERTSRVLITRRSLPLSVLGGTFMKASQNFYGETLLKALGRADDGLGTAENGRRAVRVALAEWDVAEDAVVIYDGSGLSRYNYVTADAIVTILKRVWNDERLRGPFLAALPIGGRDGTLAARMKTPELEGRVQAKTGTLNHVRALSGYLTTQSGERLVFSMIANHFTAPSSEIDAVMEKALELVAAR